MFFFCFSIFLVNNQPNLVINFSKVAEIVSFFVENFRR